MGHSSSHLRLGSTFSSSSSGTTMATTAGTLRFRAKDKGDGKLQITVVSCSDLRDADAAGIGFGNKSDPYVRVWVGKGNEEEAKKTKAISGSLNPKFPKDTSQFTFDVPGGDIFAKKIFFEVMDKDTFSADDKIGEANQAKCRPDQWCPDLLGPAGRQA